MIKLSCANETAIQNADYACLHESSLLTVTKLIRNCYKHVKNNM